MAPNTWSVGPVRASLDQPRLVRVCCVCVLRVCACTYKLGSDSLTAFFFPLLPVFCRPAGFHSRSDSESGKATFPPARFAFLPFLEFLKRDAAERHSARWESLSSGKAREAFEGQSGQNWTKKLNNARMKLETSLETKIKRFFILSIQKFIAKL